MATYNAIPPPAAQTPRGDKEHLRRELAKIEAALKDLTEYSESLAWTYVTLGADFSSTVITNATILSFTPAANKKYEFEARLLLQSSAVTTGVRPGVAWPGGYLDGAALTEAPEVTTTASVLQFNNPVTGNANAASTGVAVISRSYLGRISGLLIMGPSPTSTLRITIASEVAASAVSAMAGSFLRYRELP